MPRKHDEDEDNDWEDVTEDDDEEFDEVDEDEDDLPFGELPLDDEDYEAYADYMEEFGWDDDYFDAIYDVLDNGDDSDFYES